MLHGIIKLIIIKCRLMRNGWMCGLETVNGGRLPKICCPTAALIVKP